MNGTEITLLLYNLALLPVVFFSVFFLIMTIISLIVDKKPDSKLPRLTKFPFVTVQIPTYNDLVALRCVKACQEFTYPKEKYEIMIVDDSTDQKVTSTLKKYAKKHGLVFVHRDNRDGYKPGALKECMHLVNGEIITLFDSDFIPHKDFLQQIIRPFTDPKVAIVQGRWSFINTNKNLITRFASYILMVQHHIFMPINNKANVVFLCGTAGAIRTKILNEVGGWNAHSITEDMDLSVKILSKGYKNVYLPFDTPNEVPETLESFLKQQMRWSFGGVRVFLDNAKKILYKSKLNLQQRLLISFMTMGNLVAPLVLLMTVLGFMGWFSGDIKLFGLTDFMQLILKFVYTSGFLVMAGVMLYKHKNLNDFPKLVLATFSISLILATANSIAIYKAIFRKDKPLYGNNSSWIVTPKKGNEEYK